MVCDYNANLMSRTTKSQSDFGELFPTEAVQKARRTPTGQWAVAPPISTRLQPGVSGARWSKPFQRFAPGHGEAADAEAVETAPACARTHTGLKPGANERSKQFLPAFFFAPSAPFCG